MAMRSAKRPHRPEAEFFATPTDTAQRRYEALRAYFLEGATAAQAAARFGYAESSVQAMVRDFRRGDRAFFARRRPGPRVAPAKQAARDQVLRLRAAGHSITEITQALATTTPLNRTGVWELLSEEGYERLPTRPTGQRGGPRRDHPPRTRRITWPAQPLRLPSDFAGLLLLVPGLVTLDLPGAVSAAHFPGTREVPAISSVLSLLALKATGQRRPDQGRPGRRGADVRPTLAAGHRQTPRAAGVRLQGHHRRGPVRAPPGRHPLPHPARPQPQARRRAGRAARHRVDPRHPGPHRPLPPPPRPRGPSQGAGLPGLAASTRRARPGPRGSHPHPHQQPHRQARQAHRPLRQAHDHRAASGRADPLLPPGRALQRGRAQRRPGHPLTVWAQAAYDALRRRLPGYTTATPDTIWRRFVSTSGQLTLGPTQVVVRIAERTSSPVLRSADLPEIEVPWWGGRRLRFEIAVGKK